jgi:hypothetical protein
VVVDERVFVYGTENVTTGNVVSDLELSGVEVPRDTSVKSLGVDTTCRKLAGHHELEGTWTHGECR